MTHTLTLAQRQLHLRAVEAGKNHRQSECRLIEVLHEVDKTKLYRKFDCSSLFVYAVKFLALDESIVYPLITVARKAAQIPQLERSLKNQKLSVPKASRLVSILTRENADGLIQFAEQHTTLEINREVTRLRQGMGLPAKLRTVQVSDETLAKIKRARSLKNNNEDIDTVLGRVLDEHLDRHDPVKKAKRVLQRKLNLAASLPSRSSSTATEAKEVCTYRVSKPIRKPLAAVEKHTVFSRDGGQCTHIDSSGQRCQNDRFLHIHHIQPVSQGGSNDPENLTTLCSFHHDLTHQLTLPIEGQITWLRETRIEYGL